MCIARTHESPGGRPMQQVQEVPADGVVLGLDLDALAGVAEVIPVAEHRAEAGEQAVGDVARAGGVVIVPLRQRAPERRDAGAHHVHRMTGGGQLLEHRAARLRKPRSALSFAL